MIKNFLTAIRVLFLGLFFFLLVNGKIMLWLGLFVVSLVAALFFGRVYCGYVCPMNTLMIAAEGLSKKLGLQTERTPKWLKNGYFSWIFLVISVSVMLVLKRRFGINLSIFPLWLAVSFLVTLRYKPQVIEKVVFDENIHYLHMILNQNEGLPEHFSKF